MEKTGKTGKNETVILKVENLSYKYLNGKEKTLKKLYFEINKNEKIAIVGLNGAGKSTLIKCLSGLYNDYEGSIKFKGTEVREYDKNCIGNQIKTVFQDAELYPFSIAENISGYDDINPLKINSALKDVKLYEKISKLPKGLDTNITTIFDENGVNFSGGESQLLEFTRVLYKNAEVVILDEPTGSLDIFSERNFFNKVKEIMYDKTCIFVTHRLSSIKDMDKIIVLEKGEIIESGSNDELLKNKGRYYELYNIQKKYYKGVSYE